jgi:hypothetical protein
MSSDHSGYINGIMDAEKWLSENRGEQHAE